MNIFVVGFVPTYKLAREGETGITELINEFFFLVQKKTQSAQIFIMRARCGLIFDLIELEALSILS